MKSSLDPQSFKSSIIKDIDSLAAFTKDRKKIPKTDIYVEVREIDYDSKVFQLAIPDRPLTAEQIRVLNDCADYAEKLNIEFVLTILR